MKGKVLVGVGLLIVVASINWVVVAALGGALLLLAIIGMIVSPTSERPDAKPKPAKAKPKKQTEPVRVAGGWQYPGGETVDEETHSRRLLAEQLVLPAERRDPVWMAALAARDKPINELAAMRQAAENWLRAYHARAYRILDRSTEDLERLCAQRGLTSSLPVGTNMRARDLADALSRWLERTPKPEPDRTAVLHLERQFSLTTDCSNGHFADHGIVSAADGRVTRECRYCDPSTRWTEEA
ncbi:hypothetical protein L1857_26310 [Amycolatopsis thermalba]|uniref:Uncharacterized protein n=1 Tax=Amycolatopsis thermalba TaxID=944492 RepID=A0ABY4P1D6_9PSEU|nr:MULTISPECIES: hypothetical protein [Amycolatopsis]UQS26076.1 hypothetical protein L1857_26310 [Amycolatopsis thermalba]